MKATLFSPAKLNLFLNIISELDNGYHEIESLFVKVSLYDVIFVEITDGDGGIIVDSNIDPPIELEENSCYKAITNFFASRPMPYDFKVYIHKNIPIGAGLGGGSSNAGVLLAFLNKLYGFYSESELLEVGLGVGADVPFFISEERFSLVRGVGEVLNRVDVPIWVERLKYIVVFPEVSVSTAEVYKALKLTGPLRGVNMLISEQFSEKFFYNALKDSLIRVYEGYSDILDSLSLAGGKRFFLTGSGSSCFCPYTYDDEIDWVGLMRLVNKKKWRLWCVESV